MKKPYHSHSNFSLLSLPAWAYLLTAGFVAGLAFVSFTFYRLQKEQNDWRENVALVTRTHQIVQELRLSLAEINELESQNRGFIITRDTEYIRLFDQLERDLFSRLYKVRSLMLSSALQQQHDIYSAKARERTSQLRENMRLLQAVGPKAAEDYIRAGVGKRTKEDLVSLVRAMEDSLAQLRAQREKAAAESDRDVNFALQLSFAANITLLSICFLLFMRHMLQRDKERMEQRKRDWINSAILELTEKITAGTSLASIAEGALSIFAARTPCSAAVFFALEEEMLERVGTLATVGDRVPKTVSRSEGLLGAALNSRAVQQVKDIPPDYWLRVGSALGHTLPREIVIVPLDFEGYPQGVIELASLAPFEPAHFEFIEASRDRLAVALHAARSRKRLEELLAKTQQQAEELQTQQEELRVTNEELQQQAEVLRQSEVRLEEQQKELEENNSAVEEQKQRLQRMNEQLRGSEEKLIAKAYELETAGRYKSEFLANMSHELRTPLNSVLILAQLMAENRTGNLTADQIESAHTILSASSDLLNLINDVLDLAKIESGYLEVTPENFSVREIIGKIERALSPQAAAKHIALSSKINAPQELTIATDRIKLEQILKNLVGNAIKFTDHGSVEIIVEANGESGEIAIHVRDTGVGIPADKHQVIFDAFKQADGTTSRKHGGTGLGLSIARQLTQLIGGRLTLASEPGKGSTFTLFLPPSIPQQEREASPPISSPAADNDTSRSSQGSIVQVLKSLQVEVPAARRSAASEKSPINDDRDNLAPGDRPIQFIEDEREFAGVLCQLARQYGFKSIVSESGESGLEDARKYQPVGIVLDLKLPGMGGIEVLDALKSNPETRHIPVHIVSGVSMQGPALNRGAMGYLLKPASTEQLRSMLGRVMELSSRSERRLLLVEDEETQIKALTALLGGEGVTVITARNGEEAYQLLIREQFDCMVLDLRLPDMDGIELLKRMADSSHAPLPPVVVYTGKQLTRYEEEHLQRYADSIIIKGARSPERLLDQTTLFLHQMVSKLPTEKRAHLKVAGGRDAWLEDRRILLTDDDMRNVYALVKTMEERGARVEIARNGQEAVDFLAGGEHVDVVLMDIMMPVMDGFDAMRTIRAMPGLKNLPIIALTAKAMKADRDRCFEAGASDYLTKPIDLNRLFSVLKVWISGRAF
jgi:CheY-like chemotaxis protein/CHASE3 domain sensor protein